MISYRDHLIYLAVTCNGNRNLIIREATKRCYLNETEVKDVVSKVRSNVLTYLDPEYPSYLRNLNECPIVLFYYGDISLINDENQKRNLAVVGSRKATEYGLFHTDKIVKEVAKKCNIVSGLASGIDAQAHQTALDCGAKTIAVLGSGIDYPWPTENALLYMNIIKEGGLVISEYPNMSEPDGYHFPIRNRLIVMFSNAVLITEAHGLRTGTSITARLGLDYGRSVMAIPYSLDVVDSFCNTLIYEGCILVRDGTDILIDMDLEEIKNI